MIDLILDEAEQRLRIAKAEYKRIRERYMSSPSDPHAHHDRGDVELGHVQEAEEMCDFIRTLISQSKNNQASEEKATTATRIPDVPGATPIIWLTESGNGFTVKLKSIPIATFLYPEPAKELQDNLQTAIDRIWPAEQTTCNTACNTEIIRLQSVIDQTELERFRAARQAALPKNHPVPQNFLGCPKRPPRRPPSMRTPHAMLRTGWRLAQPRFLVPSVQTPGRMFRMSNGSGKPKTCPGRSGCGWVTHNRKHFPHVGMTKEHTQSPNPAKYLPGTTAEQIQEIETETVRAALRQFGGPPPVTVEYLRDAGRVIGWSLGEDATLSFVECTSRSYHGRPITSDDPKLSGWK